VHGHFEGLTGLHAPFYPQLLEKRSAAVAKSLLYGPKKSCSCAQSGHKQSRSGLPIFCAWLHQRIVLSGGASLKD
jgi:hypothetical protein